MVKPQITALKTSNASPARAYTNMTPLRMRGGDDEIRPNFGKQRKSLEVFKMASAKAAQNKTSYGVGKKESALEQFTSKI